MSSYVICLFFYLQLIVLYKFVNCSVNCKTVFHVLVYSTTHNGFLEIFLYWITCLIYFEFRIFRN